MKTTSNLIILLFLAGLLACEDDKKFVAQDPGSSVLDVSTDLVPDTPYQPAPDSGGTVVEKPAVQPGQEQPEPPEPTEPGKPPKQQTDPIVVDVIDEAAIREGLRAIAEDCLTRIKVGVPYECDLTTVSGDEDITFAIANPPEGLTIDPVTGQLHWTPTEDQLGRHVLDVVTMQGQHNTVTQLTLVVFENTPPTFTGLDCETEVAIGLPWECQVTADDPDGDALTFTLEVAPDGMTIDEHGLISWTAEPDDSGWNNFVVQVEDGTAQDSFQQLVHAYDPNNPPIFEFVDCALTAEEDTWYECGFVLIDDSIPDEMSLWLEDFPEGMLFDREAQTVSLLVQNVEAATKIEYTVVMDVLGVEHRERNFFLALPMNDPPSLRFLDCGAEVFEDELYVCRFETVDPDGGEVFLSLDAFPAGMTLDEAAGLVSWRPGNTLQATEEPYELTVSDGRLAQRYPKAVTVLPVNDLPGVRFEDCAQSAEEDSLYSCTFLTLDLDNDEVVTTLLDGPAGMVLEDGTLTWLVPNVLEEETQTFTLLLDDGQDQVEVSRSLTLLPVNDSPTLSFRDCAVTAAEDTVYSCSFFPFDLDGDVVTASLEDGPLGMSLDLLSHRLTWTVPNAATPYDVVYAIRLDDGQEQPRFEQTFEVLPVNDAPSFRFVSCADRVFEDETLRCTYETADPDGDVVTVTLLEGPAGMLVDEAQHQILWTVPNVLAETEVSFRVRVSDGTVEQLYARTVLTLPVNDAPTLVFENCPATISEDQLYTCGVQVADIDGDSLTWFVVGGPAGMLAEPLSERVSWNVPNTLIATTVTFEVVVQDGNAETRGTRSVQALPANDPPALTLLACPAEVDEDETFVCYYQLGDIDGDPLLVYLEAAPPGMTVDQAQRKVSYLVPNTLERTPISFTLTADDGQTETQAGASFDALPRNDAPLLTFQNCATTVLENAVYSCSYSVADLDGDSVTVELSGQAEGMTLDTLNRTITWIAPEMPAEPSRVDVSYRVLFGDGTLTLSLERPLSALAVNDAPTITLENCPAVIEEDQQYTCSVFLADPDGDVLAWSLSGAPTGMLPDLVNGRVVWTVPNTLAETTVHYDIVVQDGAVETRRAVSFQVLPVNDPPSLTLLSCPTRVNEDASFVCYYQTGDLDGDRVTVTLADGPAGMILDQTARRVTYLVPNTVTETQVSFTLEADDGHVTVTAEGSFEAVPQNDAPTLTFTSCPTSVLEDETYTCTYTLADLDGDEVTVTLAGQPLGMILDQGSRTISWTVPNIAAPFEDFDYQLELSDGEGGTATYQRPLRGLPQNDAPTIDFLACPTAADEDELYLCTFQLSDLDNDGVTVTLVGAPTWLRVVGTSLTGVVPNTLVETTLEFTVRIGDGQAVVEVPRSLTLTPLNDAPTLSLLDCPPTVDEDEVYTCRYQVGDIDNDPVTVTLQDLAGIGLVLDTVNRTITYPAPNTLEPITRSFTLTADDGETGTELGGSFQVLPQNDAPTISFQNCATTVLENESYLCAYTVSDLDGDIPTVALVDPPAWITLDPNTPRIFGTVPELDPTPIEQPQDYQVQVSDGTTTVTVARPLVAIAVNDAPMISFGDCVTSLEEDQVYTCSYTLSDSDTPPGDVSVDLTAAPAGMTLDRVQRTVTWSVPNILTPHAESFTLRAYDGETTTNASQSVLVVPVNDPPVITLQDCPSSVNEDAPYTCTYTVSDLDGDALTVTLLGGPAGLVHDAENLRATWTVPNTLAPTAYTYQLEASDGAAQTRAGTSFTALPQNDAPTIDFLVCPTSANEDETYSCTYQLTDLDGDGVAVTLLGAPAWLQVDGGGNRLVGTVPNTLSETTLEFTVRLSDGTAAVDTQATLTLLPRNDAPALSFVDCPTSAREDELYVCTYLASDLDGDPLALELLGAPVWLALDEANARLYGTVPNTVEPETLTFTLVASDGQAQTSRPRSVTLAPQNDAPTITVGPCDATVNEDDTYTCSYTVADLDGDDLTVTILSGPPELIHDPVNHSVSFLAPNTLVPTEYRYQLEVEDGTTSARAEAGFTAMPQNDAPTLEFLVCPASADEDEAYTCTFQLGDLDGDLVSASLLGAPAWLRIDAGTNRLFGTVPNTLTETTLEFTVRIGDGQVDVDTPHSLTLFPGNDAPTLSLGDCPASVREDESYLCTYTVGDPDGDALTVSFLGAPTWLTLDRENGRVTGTVPNTLTQTTVTFTLTVDDGQLQADVLQSLVLLPQNDPPTITLGPCQNEVWEDALYECSYTVTDLDGDSLTVALIGGPTGMDLDQVNRRVTFLVPNTLEPTDYSYQLEVGDGTALVRAAATFTALPQNDPPSIDFLSCPTSANEDEALSCTYQLADLDGDAMTVTLVGAPTWLRVDQGGSRLFGTVPEVPEETTLFFTVSLDDGQFTVDNQRTLTLHPVNDAPVLSFSGCPDAVYEDAVYTCTYAVSDPDGTIPTVSLVGAPAWLGVDAVNSRLTGSVPNTVIQQTLTYQVTASDGQFQTTRSQSVLLLPVNDPPTIVLVACPTVVAEDATYTCTYQTADLDGDPVEVSLFSAPDWMSLDLANHRVNGVAPNVLAETSFGFTLAARDAATEVRTSGSVRVTPMNDPPTLTFTSCAETIAEKSLINGLWVYGVFRCDFTVSDQDGTIPTVSVTGGPTGLVLTNGNRRVEYTIPEITSDTVMTFTLTVSDAEFNVPYPRSVTAVNVNLPPVLASIGNQTVPALGSLVLQLLASDPDQGQLLTFQVSGLPAFAAFDGARTITFSPGLDDLGPYPITVTVSDGSASDSETFGLTVEAAGPQDATDTVDLQGNTNLKVDILFVMDTSGSMDWVAAGVSDFLQDFLGEITKPPMDQHLDFQIALMLAHSNTPWSGRLYNYGTAPKILKKSNYLNPDGSVNLTALQAAFAMNFEHYVGGQPDGGEAGLYSYHKALTDWLAANSTGNFSGIPDLHDFFRPDATLNVIWLGDENDVCYRYGIDPSITYTNADINWLCTNHRTHVDFFGQDTDNSNECSSYFSLCFSSATQVLQRHPAARTITAESIYDKTAQVMAAKGERSVSMSGIIFRDMDNPSLYPQYAFNGENQTGRGYKEAIKVSLGNPDLLDDDPAFLGHVVDMLEIKAGNTTFEESMAKLGAVAGAVAVDVTLDHEPIPDTLFAFIVAVNGVPLAELDFIEVSVQPKDGPVVSVIIPGEYYFDNLQLDIDFQYLP